MNVLPFNILYLDLNLPDMIEKYGSYDYYGGGSIVARAMIRRFSNFYIAARQSCFEDMPDKHKHQCIILEEHDIELIRGGQPLVNTGLSLDFLKDIQLINHHFSNLWVNTSSLNCKTCHWNVGYRDVVHPKNKYVILFDLENQSPIYYSNNHLIFQAVIGPKMPLFQEYQKEDYIFCCGRITNSYQSIQIAQLANKYRIPMIFAGPLDKDNNYGNEFMRHVHGDIVQYYGVIDNDIKIDLFKKAKLTCQFMNYPISVTLSQKEASARGVGCLATPVGQYRTWLRELENGFFVRSEEDFVRGWENRSLLSQKNCYNSVLQFSEDKMIEKFVEAFNNILNE